MRRRLRVALLGATLALVALAAGPPLVSAITSTLLVESTMKDPVKINNDGIKLKTKDATDVAVQDSVFQPGDFVDWHNHPGFALIAVKSGAMTFLDPDCRAHVISEGEAFVESGGPTYAVNEGAEPAHFFVTFMVPKDSPRIVFTDPPECASGDNGDEDNDQDSEDEESED